VNSFTGHSFLPHDSNFGDNESTLKVQEIVCNLDDYIRVMQKARKNNPAKSDTILQQDFPETYSEQEEKHKATQNATYSNSSGIELQTNPIPFSGIHNLMETLLRLKSRSEVLDFQFHL
jgi:hypothetical protein